MEKRRVLFVCTHNSARSQMAEGMLRAFGADAFEAFSAGTEATGIKPETIQVMDEIGIDISGQRSKTIDEFYGQDFEWFITVCDEAQKNCPVLPGVEEAAHRSIEDPSAASGTPEERVERFDAFVTESGTAYVGSSSLAGGPTFRLRSQPLSANAAQTDALPAIQVA